MVGDSEDRRQLVEQAGRHTAASCSASRHSIASSSGSSPSAPSASAVATSNAALDDSPAPIGRSERTTPTNPCTGTSRRATAAT